MKNPKYFPVRPFVLVLSNKEAALEGIRPLFRKKMSWVPIETCETKV